jgi:hypothetical protein
MQAQKLLYWPAQGEKLPLRKHAPAGREAFRGTGEAGENPARSRHCKPQFAASQITGPAQSTAPREMEKVRRSTILCFCRLFRNFGKGGFSFFLQNAF